MEFISYQMTGSSTSTLNSGSYMNRTEYSLFVKEYAPDVWYGLSSNDAIELGIWDKVGNPIGWTTYAQSTAYTAITLSYNNVLNFPTTYFFGELSSNFITYENQKILLNPTDQLSSSFGITEGSYTLTYNFVREMAGSVNNPLVIKEISPSRTEIKLVPLSASNYAYDAFCKKQILLSDVSSLYLQSLKNCPYGQIYNNVSSIYQSQINTIKSLFFITTDGAMITFLRNLYEDIFVYTSVAVQGTAVDTQNVQGSSIRIQGIQSSFNNYLVSNSNEIVNFSTIDSRFKSIVSASIERKFSPIGKNPPQQYVEAKQFVFDYFTKHYYNPITEFLSSKYEQKYFGSLKNALNFGNNLLLPIINSDMMDERIDPKDPITLLVKLKSELPSDLAVQSVCWVSNVSLTPYIVNAILPAQKTSKLHKIGAPNFSIAIPNTSLTNTNLSYTADDLQESSNTENELDISRKIGELSVDYSDFNNFVVFSSAELRLNIFKNKMINLSSLSSSLKSLTEKNVAYISSSGYQYPLYTEEYDKLQSDTSDVINSFDGYESYLYRNRNYVYANGSFISSSYVSEMDFSASYYDKNNRDSMVNNCPEHVLLDRNNDEYIIFISMIGHYFDQIYTYISSIPSEKRIGHDASAEFTRKIVDYMLESFGWKLDDSLEQTNLINNYLNSQQLDGLNSMSSEDRLKTIRNRLLINLPQIYKTKGTDEAVRLILACYGIPSSLLSIREYGGVSYTDDSAAYTAYERVYMRQWNTSSAYDTYYVQSPTGSNTFLFKFSIDSSEPYAYGNEHILFGKPFGTYQTISGSGEWAVGFVRTPEQNFGKLFFRIGYKGYETFKLYSSEFPMFDGNIYSVMLRRNLVDAGFEYTSNADAVPTLFDLNVQRNEFGRQVLRLTSSKICYDVNSNTRFGSGGTVNLIGWFSYHNGQGYTGTFDKFQIWNDALSDNNFEDYTNNINAYSLGGTSGYSSLYFRMHTDYPEDQRQIPSGSSLSPHGISATDWLGVWRNANPYYATGSVEKIGDDVDYMVNFGAWEGAQTLVYDSASCQYVSQSCYPYQFKIVEYPNTWAISKYGPNKFRNEKVVHVSQSISTRFDDKGRSTYSSNGGSSPNSNQIGLFVDPQDFKNKDIARYYGNTNFMDSIGSPSNQFESEYSSLKSYRTQYANSLNQYSGSRTLVNELNILYKLYFNKSIFETIKNVLPARASVFTGIVIEPTILERPKYASKEIFSEANSGSVSYFEITASHYFRDPDTKLLKLSSSIDYGQNITIGFSKGNHLLRDYPTNYGGNYISDTSDSFVSGHFSES